MKRAPFTIPGPLEVLRVLPKVGLHLLLPAMVLGAVFGSLFDLLMTHSGYPVALAGLVLGPVVFAFAINGITRADEAYAEKMAAYAESYRKAENAKRTIAAQERGDLVQLEEHRARRR
ncbi:hypothetical protein [Jannaschia pohangensis]|uniref:Uncharacterized protein n=1 Tax=Jannaschia pohangensis TaxID=390807 RepID=A0A1I3GD64_9RHOB|nr:hypothetical protein [Jannaschia pohangensis]SFI21393.1 hypothetical protein SAMN04488095_0149 [Jannaschia pohangensis]